MSEIKVELGEPEVEIDHAALAQSLLEECGESITEIANEAIEHYMRYELDVSDMVSDQVSDSINDTIDSLLSEVGPGSLCGLGSSFSDAVRTLLVHHIDMKQVLIENYEMVREGGISKLVQDAMKKEMVVNVSFVDKQPAEEYVSSASGNIVVDEYSPHLNTIPGPVDEINTRSENV